MTPLFRKDSRRILAVWFPYLGPERIWRQRLGRSWRSRQPQTRLPLVVSHRDSNTQRIAALDEQAEALKLKPGMGIADARAMHPSIDVVEADPEADRRLLEALADWCDRYTPLVALDGDRRPFSRHHRLRPSVRRRRGDAGRTCLPAIRSRVSMRAPALARRRARPGRRRGSRLPPVGSGEEAMALSPLPLVGAAHRCATSAPAWKASACGRSARFLPRRARRSPAVSARTLMLRLDQALGRVEEAISPRLPVAGLSVERHFAEPISLTEDIERLVLHAGGHAQEAISNAAARAPAACSCAVPGRRRGQPHRRRHIAAAARAAC